MLYAIGMSTIDVSEARQQLPAVIDRAQTEAVTLVRYGRPAAVLLSPARYEQLLTAAEDAEDVAAFDEAMAEEGANIPWDQVKADLGWT
jgi:antitoxin Phd